MTGWRDTTGAPMPRSDGAMWEARWLVGRHPRVQMLMMRLGVWDDEEDEEGRWVNVDALRATVIGLDEYMAAMGDYMNRTREPADDAAYDAWLAAGPQTAAFGPPTKQTHGKDSVHAFAVMSGGEKRLVRLLATIGNDRVPWCTADLWGLDDEGWAFVHDWITLLLPR